MSRVEENYEIAKMALQDNLLLPVLIDIGKSLAVIADKMDTRPKHGHWERMSDLPEDKDDRYKCSRCGNVVHHSNGVNLYTFNSWCGRCGSLNNSLIAGSELKGEKGTE